MKKTYITVVEPVFEVTLLGTASLSAWEALLESEGLTISGTEAQIVLSATEMRYMGIRFRECSVSLLIDEQQALLLHAFNSNRFFAWVERNFFHTHYYHAAIVVSENHFAVYEQGEPIIEASLSEKANLSGSGHEAIERVVLLKRSSASGKQAYFHARLEGQTRHFDITGGSIHYFERTGHNPTLDLLRQSGFQLGDWSVRSEGRHSKSKTYQQA